MQRLKWRESPRFAFRVFKLGCSNSTSWPYRSRFAERSHKNKKKKIKIIAHCIVNLGRVRIHDFRNGGHRESPGSSCMKTRSDSLFLYTMASTSIFLTENDIPGASLLGRKPEELKI